MQPPRHRAFPVVGIILAVLLSTTPLAADPRPRDALSAGEIAHALARLEVAGSALYVAAHPDDENTALLAWLTHVRGVRTGYLSMTRGDGGQNLLGQEFGAPLGVIRTQELLAARRLDGAEQMFTRALDFGFSKNAEETLDFWNHDSILADVVWAIRRFRPDVIITRFPPDSTAGHGHHTASAMLAEEAFAAAADPKRFPEQLDRVKPWQARRLLWNVFTPAAGAPIDSTWLVADVGAYDPLLGRSMSEIAGLSRSNHKSQGFGAPERRGSLRQYLVSRAGAPARRDLFEGMDVTWKRYRNGAAVASAIAQARSQLDPAHPEASLPRLAKALAAMRALDSDPLVERKRAELEWVMASCAGLWLEAVATRPSATPGATITVATSALARGPAAVTLESVAVGAARNDSARPLAVNRATADTLRVTLAPDAPITQPYWLRQPASRGRFVVPDRDDLGRPDNRPALTAAFRVRIAGESIVFELPVAYRWIDSVQGERWRMLEVSPPVTLKLDRPFLLFPDATARAVRVTVRANQAGASGAVKLAAPAGYRIDPASAAFTIEREGQEQSVSFTVTPGTASGTLTATASVNGASWSLATQTIDYPHIPVQTLFPPAEMRLVRTDLKAPSARVGYLAGSGDVLPEALRQMGMSVTLLGDDDVESGDLSRFDVIVTGVRAYNTRPRLRSLQPRLLDWAAKGGTLVVQYVTTADGVVDYLGPFPFRVSRDRVTVEEAPVTFAQPASRLLTTPNPLAPADFTGWVQERGLYFASPFDPRYEAPLSAHDPGEPARDGGLLVAKTGSGTFVYCAYALFRQIPAGVPGAFRLLANLVSAR
jgi:LmbE family N-acetylglucosaminyl deacetylase